MVQFRFSPGAAKLAKERGVSLPPSLQPTARRRRGGGGGGGAAPATKEQVRRELIEEAKLRDTERRIIQTLQRQGKKIQFVGTAIITTDPRTNKKTVIDLSRKGREVLRKDLTRAERIVRALRLVGQKAKIIKGKVVTQDPKTKRIKVIDPVRRGREILADVPSSAEVRLGELSRQAAVKGKRLGAVQFRITSPQLRKITSENIRQVLARVGVESISIQGASFIERQKNNFKKALELIRTLPSRAVTSIKERLRKQMQGKADLEKVNILTNQLKSIEKNIGKGFIDFGISLGRGLLDNLKGAYLSSIIKLKFNIPEINKATRPLMKHLRLLEKKRKRGIPITQVDKEKARKLLRDYSLATSSLKKNIGEADALARKHFKTNDAKLTRAIAVFAVGGAIGLGIGGAVAKVTGVVLGTVGGIATTQQGIETVKNPTARNFGRLAFFAIPTAISILKTLGKLTPSFRPTVKNVGTMRKTLLNKKSSNLKLLQEARRTKDKKAIKLLEKQNRKIDQGLKELQSLRTNPEIIKATDFNPRVHTKAFRKLQGSYRDGIHVSTDTDAGALFGQAVIRKANIPKLLKKIDTRSIVKGKIRPLGLPLTLRRRADKAVLSILKRRQIVIKGSSLFDIFLARKFRRRAGDRDVGSLNPLLTAKQIVRDLKRLLPGTTIKIKKLPKAFRITVNGIELVDVGKIPQGFKTVQANGFKVGSKAKLALDKLELAITRPRPGKRAKDIADAIRLSGGKLTVGEIIPTNKNPSNVFEVVRKVEGMGKSRIAFSETHMFFDFEAPVAYSKGKPFSIIRFRRTRISKFSPSLRARIKLAANNRLTAREAIQLRKNLNRFVKANPNKFFISPRTASLPIGEREIVLAEMSRFIRKDTYKTFDNDLQTFVSIFEVGFGKPQKLSLARKFINGWRRRPFTQLRLRLTNPDILKVRRFARIVERDISLTKSQRLGFLALLKKILTGPFRGKKAQVKLPGKAPKPKKAPKKSKLLEAVKKEIIRRKIAKPTARQIGRILTRLKVPKRLIPRILRTPAIREIIRVGVRARPRVPVRIKPPVRIPTRFRKTRKPPRRVPPRRPPRKPPTRIPPGRVPPRKPPKIKIPKVPPRKPPRIVDEEKKKKLAILVGRVVVKRKFFYIPDLYSVIFGIKANPRERRLFLTKGRVFSGAERRLITGGRR